jgi:L-lactate dehydrogenase complex protein LldE
VHQVREHLTAIPQTDEVIGVRHKTFELVEFLHDVLKIEEFPWAAFPHKVAYHANCNALRGIHHARPSEINLPYYSKPLDLLAKVKGIEIVTLTRPDECCGFGGTFSVFEPAVSAKMGYDKVTDQARAGAAYVVSADSSCLMHQKGCAERLGVPLKYIHIAQVLNGAAA